jgi:uncharacterized protein YqgV (UPF0045/DUF77 family)
MPKRLKLSQSTLNKLKKANWSEWVKVFNQVHNSAMFTSVGVINIKIDEEKDKHTKKDKKRD